jgi:hypothetical protein
LNCKVRRAERLSALLATDSPPPPVCVATQKLLRRPARAIDGSSLQTRDSGPGTIFVCQRPTGACSILGAAFVELHVRPFVPRRTARSPKCVSDLFRGGSFETGTLRTVRVRLEVCVCFRLLAALRSNRVTAVRQNWMQSIKI